MPFMPIMTCRPNAHWRFITVLFSSQMKTRMHRNMSCMRSSSILPSYLIRFIAYGKASGLLFKHFLLNELNGQYRQLLPENGVYLRWMESGNTRFYQIACNDLKQPHDIESRG